MRLVPILRRRGLREERRNHYRRDLLELDSMRQRLEKDSVILRVHPDVAKQLKASRSDYRAELEEVLRPPVMVTADPLPHHKNSTGP